MFSVVGDRYILDDISLHSLDALDYDASGIVGAAFFIICVYKMFPVVFEYICNELLTFYRTVN